MNPYLRHRARGLALQALYQWTMAGTAPETLEREFLIENPPKKVDQDYFKTLVYGVLETHATLDTYITQCATRPKAQLDPVELSVLRIGLYELAHRLDIPYRVVINEALELNKRFGTEQGHKFVNGILHQAATQLRRQEQEDSDH